MRKHIFKLIHGVRQFSGSFGAKTGLMFIKKPLQFFVNSISYKCNTNMRFNAFFSVMVNRPDFKIGF